MTAPTADRFARPVLEAALAQARRDAADVTAPVPPKVLHPYLNFTRVPDRALTAARVALDDDAFRGRVAATLAGDDALAPELRDLVDRPEGWAERFAAAVESFAHDEIDHARAADEASARRQLASSEAMVERVTTELASARRELSGAVAAAAGLESELASTRAALAAAEERAGQAEEERARAVRELKQTEQLMMAKVAELRHAQSRAEVVRAQVAPPPPAEVAPPVDVSAELRTALAGLTGAMARLGIGAPVRTAVRARRPTARLERGVVDGTPEAVAQRLSLGGVVVFVDGWNLAMQGWPHLDQPAQRRRVVDGLGDLAVRHRCEVHVVFDGQNDGMAATRVGAAGIRVHFTPEGLEADDRILELIDVVDVARPVVVVSNDRRVRRGAVERGAMVLGSTEMVDAIGS